MVATDFDCPPRPVARRPSRSTVVVCTAAVGLLVGATVWSRLAAEPAGLDWLDVAVAVTGCALVPVTLRWPVGGGLALGLLAVLSPVATPAATFGAFHVARRRPFAQAVVVSVVGVAGHAAQGWWRPYPGLSYGWLLLLTVLAYAALLGWGTWARARAALVNSLRERARRAEAEQGRRVVEARLAERTRLAREMHDVLAHRLSLLAVYAGALEYRPDSSPERLSAAAGVIRAGVHQALDELREVITLLRQDPTDTEPDGPGPALDDVPRLVGEAREAGLVVDLDDRIGLPVVGMTAVTGRTAYRVVQEALTNARKHAGGQPVTVTLAGEPGGTLTVDVHNPLAPDVEAAAADGPDADLPGAGLGLLGLAERVGLAGGRLDHAVDAAGEFRLRVELPWRT
ncbi:histidine kinase [Plantactinospora sp. B5E13]|uniref:sensor histidine kinase n=1 Tax=Plantactinospora sp. B5E13 TaxID=3153758 RepID=UPI00325D4455